MSFEWEQGPLLGSGGMADVYLAIVKEPTGPRLVALKRLRAGMLTPQLTKQLEREAQIGALLKHPNVVRVEASGQDEKGPWLAMEYVAGRSARQLVRAHLELSRFMALPVAATIACDAAKGLAYVHSVHDPDQGLHDLVHRDISSDNILVDLDGLSKLADFGVARISGAAGLTRAGAFKGKVGYAAPELLSGAPPTHKSDYFAFAATVYELFTGRYAFVGKNEVETIDNVANRPAPLLDQAPPDVAEWVAAAFEKLPKNRPDSLTALVLALNKMAAGHPAVVVAMHEVGADCGVKRADALTTQLSKGPRTTKPWLLAVPLVASIAAIAWLVPAVMKGDPPAPPSSLPAPAKVEPKVTEAPAPPPDEKPAPAKPPRKVEHTALVKFNITPWADIWLNGKKLGIAPMEARIPVGRQTFEVRNTELQVVTVTSIDVVEGHVNELNLNLRE